MAVRGEFTGGEALTEAQVSSVGIAREGKLGAIGLRIGRHAGESVMDALRNGKIEDSEALVIADFAPGNENVQRKGLAILMEGGSKTEARERMVAELELAKMAEELGIEQGEDLFGNTMDNDAWLDYVAKYVVRRRNEITKDIQYLRTTATRKNAKAMAEKYGVDVKDPDGMKKALREAESLRDRWKNPYTDAELMEEIKGAYRVDHPEGGEGGQGERIMADYSRYIDERESVTHFSTSGEREEKKYRVVNDSAGLQQHLDKKVEPIEINFGKLSEAAMKAEWAEMGKGAEFKVTAYSREKITRELIRLAKEYHDYLEIGETGYRVQLPTSRTKAKPAAGRIRNAVKAQAVSGLLDVIKKAVHLNSTTPRVTASTGKKKEKAMANIASYERFGYPVKLNGEDYVFWFNGTTEKKDSRDLQFYEFGLVAAKNKETEASRSTGSGPDTENAPVSERTLGDFLSNVKDKDVINVEKVDNAPSDGRISLPDAQAQGMFKDGKMQLGNAVITEPADAELWRGKPGVTHFSVDGVQHVSPHEFEEFDLKHIGSGEGAQAYGWGLYFMTNWGVNRFYHTNFTRKVRVDGKKVKEYPMNYLEDLKVEDHELMGWDERNGVEGADPDMGRLSYKVAEMVLFGKDADIERKLEVLDEHKWANDEWEYHYRKERENADDMFVDYWASVIVNNEYTGNEVYRTLAHRLGSPKAASEYLLAQGIKGIRYADGTSRGADGEKTHNYVIFDPSVIQIRKVAARKPWSSDTEDGSVWEDYEGWRARRNGGVTHFSVIGERAVTWDKYKDRAFKGRDDGMMRAELDASKAKLKKGALKKFKEYLAGWKDVCTIGDLLSFPELFEAYPWLKDRTVHRPHGRRSSAGMSSKGVMNDYINLGTKADDNATLASLLHEVQHLIQHYEGFSAGAGSNYGVEEIWRELGRQDELPNWADERYGTMYWRQAGETEARNVQKRLFMTARDRKNKPFNETLDVPSEDVMKFTLDEYFFAQYAKRVAEQGGVTHFSVAGMRARTAGANMEASYVDPADGKRKFVIPVKGARLSTGFTPGQLNAPLGGHKDVSLSALLHYPELYQAYPWLADMRVRLYNPTEKQDSKQGTTNAGGFFCPPIGGEAGYIAINSRYVHGNGERLLDVLLHESQHAIQNYEGHARGAGFNTKEEALAYIDRAIAQREEIGVEDDWSMSNLAFLQVLRRKLVEAEGEVSEYAQYYAYQHARGEQEARYTGERKEGEPMATGGSGLTEAGDMDFATVAVSSEAKELGGVTFGGLSRFDYLLESRLAPGGEFNYDRTVYQMREAIKRRAGELGRLGGEHDGAKLVAEAMAVMESVEGLLPNEYRYGLEAYKVYLSSYAKLYESGDAGEAGNMVPMDGWDKRMEGAYHNIAVRMLMGRMPKEEVEFWAHRRDTLELIEREQDNFQALVEKNAEKLRAQGYTGSERRVRREAVTRAWDEYLMEHGDFVSDVMRGIGEVRADKLVAKFLERAAMQLDAYRKDKTLGKIRRVVDRLTPLPGKDGKPVKGHLDADKYRKVVDFVRLMELTRGQRELFERERYTGEGTEKAWGELEPNDLITVPTYDADGKKLEITCTKQEFETYACFETMSAAQAEAAQRALGEFVTTGRQAWENAQEAQRARIEELCAPAMRLYGETENELHEREGVLLALDRRGEIIFFNNACLRDFS